MKKIAEIAAFIFFLAVLLPSIAPGMGYHSAYPPPAHWLDDEDPPFPIPIPGVGKAPTEMTAGMMQHGYAPGMGDVVVYDARALKRALQAFKKRASTSHVVYPPVKYKATVDMATGMMQHGWNTLYDARESALKAMVQAEFISPLPRPCPAPYPRLSPSPWPWPDPCPTPIRPCPQPGPPTMTTLP